MDGTSVRLAEYSRSVQLPSLTPRVTHELIRHLLDSFACALAGYSTPTGALFRRLAAERQTACGAQVLGTRYRVPTETAAFASSALIRCLDFNDRCPGGHPSDNIPAAVAPADAVDGRLADLAAGVVVAYDVLALLGRSRIKKGGWDHGTIGAIASACAAGRVLGLSRDELAHAIAIAATSNVALWQNRAGELSNWKGVATPYAAHGGVLAALLAAEGMTGPQAPFEGEYGLFRQVIGDWRLPELSEPPGTYGLLISDMKRWPVMYGLQVVADAGAHIRAHVDPSRVKVVVVRICQSLRASSGREPSKWDPQTRETADHSLPYVLATTLLTGAVGVDDFERERFRDPNRLRLMSRIRVEEDPAMTAVYPERIALEVEIETDKGRQRYRFEEPKGRHTDPLSDAEVEEKVRRLARDVVSAERIDTLIQTLWRFDPDMRVRDLIPLLEAAPPA